MSLCYIQPDKALAAISTHGGMYKSNDFAGMFTAKTPDEGIKMELRGLVATLDKTVWRG